MQSGGKPIFLNCVPHTPRRKDRGKKPWVRSISYVQHAVCCRRIPPYTVRRWGIEIVLFPGRVRDTGQPLERRMVVSFSGSGREARNSADRYKFQTQNPCAVSFPRISFRCFFLAFLGSPVCFPQTRQTFVLLGSYFQPSNMVMPRPTVTRPAGRFGCKGWGQPN